MHARLALAIHSATQARRPQLIVGNLARKEPLRFKAKLFDVVSNGPVVLGCREFLIEEGFFCHVNPYMSIEITMIGAWLQQSGRVCAYEEQDGRSAYYACQDFATRVLELLSRTFTPIQCALRLLYLEGQR